MKELKPCPFCGREAEMVDCEINPRWFVRCTHCGVEQANLYSSKASARDACNRRAEQGEEVIKRLNAVADALAEEKREVTGEEVIESFLNELNAIPLVRTEKDDQCCLIKVFIEDELIWWVDYLRLENAQEDARQWVLACVVGASLRKSAYNARKETENEL